MKSKPDKVEKSSSDKIYTADFETDPFLHGRVPRAFFASLYDGEKAEHYWGEDAAIWLYNKVKDLEGVVYFHNGGGFDFHFLLPYIPIETKIFLINNRLAYLKFNKVELRDSYLIMPIPLKATGEKLEIDYEDFEAERREKPSIKKKIIEYGIQDTIAQYNAIKLFTDKYGMKLTLASLAFQELKKTGYIVTKTIEAFDDKFRPFYFGGRVEFFNLGIHKGEFSCVDINSAYPYAMLDSHWHGKNYLTGTILPKRGIEQCFIHLKCHAKGCFPFRSEDGLKFPHSYEEYFITGWEYKAAKDLGLVSKEKIIKVYKPQKTANFKKYIYKFYKLKLDAEKKGDKPARLHAKLFLNSCYGRFAIDPRKHKENELKFIDELPEEGWEIKNTFEDIGKAIHERPSEKQKEYFNVCTAASITGFVRAYMLRNLHNCSGVYYCDTDSIIARDTSNIILGDKLGQWDLEAVGDSMAIAGKKLYSLRTKEGFKTASKGAKLTPQEIYELSSGKEITWKNDAPSFSLTRGTNFIERRIKRDDKRTKRKSTS